MSLTRLQRCRHGSSVNGLREIGFAYISWAFAVFVFGQEKADWVFENGQFVTPNGVIAGTMAIAGEEITFLGDESRAAEHLGLDTRQVDLEGRMVLPGLIDSHTHPLSAAMIEYDHKIPDMGTIADVLQYISERANVVEEGEWIVVQQVFITRLEEKRYPTREELDEAAPNHPVIFRTGPDASLNTLALQRFSLDRSSVAPEGSKIERLPNGEPSGILRGWSRIIELPEAAGALPGDDDRLQRLKELFADYNAVGITSVIDRNASEQAMRLYQRLEASGELSVRLGMSRAVGNQVSAAEIREMIRGIAREPTSAMPSEILRTVGIKMFLDGGMLTGSAYMRQPWGPSAVYGIVDPRYRGLRFIPRETLEAAIEECATQGLQFTAHSVGDGAVHALLEAYASVSVKRSIREIRPNITHCNFMSEEAIAKMADLGVSADIQPAWLFLDTRTLARHFGEDRLSYFQPLRAMFEAGVIAGGGSDHMQKIGPLRSINPYHPFLGMWVAITRKAQAYEGQLHPRHALDRKQALQFYTANNAYLMFMEDRIGGLEAGKLADFVVIDRDYFACPVDDVKEIQVLETWIGGHRVYSSGPNRNHP